MREIYDGPHRHHDPAGKAADGPGRFAEGLADRRGAERRRRDASREHARRVRARVRSLAV